MEKPSRTNNWATLGEPIRRRFYEDNAPFGVDARRRTGHHFFYLRVTKTKHAVEAGCRWMTIDEYRQHINDHYVRSHKATATALILDIFEQRLAAHRIAERHSAARKRKAKAAPKKAKAKK